MPSSLSEWLPEGHLAYFISDSVDGWTRRPSTRTMRQAGRATSARGRSVPTAGLGNRPAGRTIRNFRAFHLKELGELFLHDGGEHRASSGKVEYRLADGRLVDVTQDGTARVVRFAPVLTLPGGES